MYKVIISVLPCIAKILSRFPAILPKSLSAETDQLSQNLVPSQLTQDQCYNTCYTVQSGLTVCHCIRTVNAHVPKEGCSQLVRPRGLLPTCPFCHCWYKVHAVKPKQKILFFLHHPRVQNLVSFVGLSTYGTAVPVPFICLYGEPVRVSCHPYKPLHPQFFPLLKLWPTPGSCGRRKCSWQGQVHPPAPQRPHLTTQGRPPRADPTAHQPCLVPPRQRHRFPTLPTNQTSWGPPPPKINIADWSQL